MDTFRGERCGVDNCRSREYHVENDGHTYCRRGHRQEGRIEHEQDYEDLNVAASQTTRIKDSQREEQTRRELQELGGPRGLELYRHAYEHILRCQVQVLVQKGYPPELEAIVRELWALRVQIAAEDGVDLDKDGNTGLADPPGGSASEDDESDDESRRRGRGKVPSFVEMFAICYMALMILRFPISVAKMHDWISKEDLHYLGVMKVVPVSMKRKFEPWFFSVFMARAPLQRSTLHKRISDLCVMFSRQYQTFKLPSLNWKPVLFDYLIQLALPMHVFVFVHSAARVLSLDFSFPSARGRGGNTYLTKLPDVQLMAWVVFAVKFYYPFDGKERFATGPKDIAYLTIDWKAWEETHAEFERDLAERGSTTKLGTEVDMTLDQVADFDDEQADAYMDWFAKTWIETEGHTTSSDRHVRVPEGLLKMFPVDNTHQKEDSLPEFRKLEASLNNDLVRRVHGSLRPRRIISEEKAAKARRQIPRPGSIYTRYNSIEDLDRHSHAVAFYKKAAEIASIEVETLIAAVKNVEKKVKTWQGSDAKIAEARATDKKAIDERQIQGLQDISIGD